MTGIKLSRIRQCRSCPYWRIAPASLWRWPRCVYGQEIELTDEYMEGPASNCPACYWDDLKPVDMDEYHRQGEQRMAEEQARRLGPMLAIAMRGQAEAEVQERLEKMVAEGLLKAEAATEIALVIGE